MCVIAGTPAKLRERAFSVSVPAALNALPANIRDTTDLKLFKTYFSNLTFYITA